MAKEFCEEYASSLIDLTFNSKPHISMLTMLAEENKQYAPQIVQIIEVHLNKVRPEAKLPALYLIDSILKNVGQEFISLFTQNIVSTFCSVFEKVDEKVRMQMFKLRQTWNEVFPVKKLGAIDIRVNQMDPAWPITTVIPQQASIHVNPKFLKASTEEDVAKKAQEILEAEMRKQLLEKEQELFKLHQQKMELEILQARAMMENHQRQFRLQQPQLLLQQIQLLQQQQQKQQQLSLQASQAQQMLQQLQLHLQKPKSNAVVPQPLSSTSNVVGTKQPSDQRLSKGPHLASNPGVAAHAHDANKKKGDVNVSSSVVLPSSSVVQAQSPVGKVSQEGHSKLKSTGNVIKSNCPQTSPGDSKSVVVNQRGNVASKPNRGDKGKSSNVSPLKGGKSRSEHTDGKKVKGNVEDRRGKDEKVRDRPISNKKEASKLDSGKKGDGRKSGGQRRTSLSPLRPKKPGRKNAGPRKGSPSKRSHSGSVDSVARNSASPLSRVRGSSRDSGHGRSSSPQTRRGSSSTSAKGGTRSRRDPADTSKSGGDASRTLSSKSSPSPGSEDLDLRSRTVDKHDESSQSGQKRENKEFSGKENTPLVSEEEPPKKKSKGDESKLDDLFGNKDHDYRSLPPPLVTPLKQGDGGGWAQYKAAHPSEFKSPGYTMKENFGFGRQDQDMRVMHANISSGPFMNKPFEGGNRFGNIALHDRRRDPRMRRPDPRLMRPIGRGARLNHSRFDDLEHSESFNKVADRGLNLPPALLFSQGPEIMRQADQQLRTGHLSPEQHRELMEQLAKLYELQRMHHVQRCEQQMRKEFMRRQRYDEPPLHQKPHFNDQDIDRITPDVSNGDDEKAFEKSVPNSEERKSIAAKADMEDTTSEVAIGVPEKSITSEVVPSEPLAAPLVHKVAEEKSMTELNVTAPIELRPDDVNIMKDEPHLAPEPFLHRGHPIMIDGQMREVRHFGDAAIVLMDGDDPREITFKGPPQDVVIDQQIITLSFGETRRFEIDGNMHTIRFGVPSKEIIFDGVGFKAMFGGPPMRIDLNGRSYEVRLCGNPPEVCIGEISRVDLIPRPIRPPVEDRRLGTGQDPDHRWGPQLPVPEGRPYSGGGIREPPSPRRRDFGGDSAFREPWPSRGRFSQGTPETDPNSNWKRGDYGDYYPERDVNRPNARRFGRDEFWDRNNDGRPEDYRSPGARRGFLPRERSHQGRIANKMQYEEDYSNHPHPRAPRDSMFGRYHDSPRGPMPMPRDPQNCYNPRPEWRHMHHGRDNINAQSHFHPNLPGNRYPHPPDYENRRNIPPSHNTVLESSQSPSGLQQNANVPVDVSELFNKLVAAGIIPKSNTSAPPADQEQVDPNTSKNDEVPEPVEEVEVVPPMDFKSENLKVRHSSIISQLYNGIQCSSCGVRFTFDQTEKYAQHLDWHFRQNRREKDSAKKAMSRKWFYEVQGWIQFEEVEDLDERARSFFELQASEESAGHDEDSPSVPASDEEKDNMCAVCAEPFELYWEEELEEWHLRDAIRIDEKTYHPICYEDLQEGGEVDKESNMDQVEKMPEPSETSDLPVPSELETELKLDANVTVKNEPVDRVTDENRDVADLSVTVKCEKIEESTGEKQTVLDNVDAKQDLDIVVVSEVSNKVQVIATIDIVEDGAQNTVSDVTAVLENKSDSCNVGDVNEYQVSSLAQSSVCDITINVDANSELRETSVIVLSSDTKVHDEVAQGVTSEELPVPTEEQEHETMEVEDSIELKSSYPVDVTVMNVPESMEVDGMLHSPMEIEVPFATNDVETQEDNDVVLGTREDSDVVLGTQEDSDVVLGTQEESDVVLGTQEDGVVLGTQEGNGLATSDVLHYREPFFLQSQDDYGEPELSTQDAEETVPISTNTLEENFELLNVNSQVLAEDSCIPNAMPCGIPVEQDELELKSYATNKQEPEEQDETELLEPSEKGSKPNVDSEDATRIKLLPVDTKGTCEIVTLVTEPSNDKEIESSLSVHPVSTSIITEVQPSTSSSIIEGPKSGEDTSLSLQPTSTSPKPTQLLTSQPSIFGNYDMSERIEVLGNSKFQELPPVMRGTELSGLCTIL